MIEGGLLKLKIIAFKKPSFISVDKVGTGLFVVQVNPESYAVSYPILYKTNAQPAGTGGYDPPFDKNPPREISFEFLFDATGAIAGLAPGLLNNIGDASNIADFVINRGGVTAQIKWFERTCFKISGDTHVPNYLMLVWGTLLFKCRLKTLNIAYKLFSPEGFPLRAVASATFMEVIPAIDESKLPDRQSPDITHIEVVKEGDTLPIMTKRVYGDEKYYPMVAKENNLINFRRLQPGQEIYFPALKRKTEA